jgi:hypothetical protein
MSDVDDDAITNAAYEGLERAHDDQAMDDDEYEISHYGCSADIDKDDEEET